MLLTDFDALRRERRNERVTFCFRKTVTHGFEPKSVRQVVNSADQFRLNSVVSTSALYITDTER
jgi:hypothetical protein